MMTHEKEEEQAANLARVESNIAPIVIAFLDDILKPYSGGGSPAAADAQFHLQELQEYVSKRTPSLLSPDSPSRILRSLRRQGLIDYKVLNRRQSLYLFLGFKQPSPTAQ